MSFSKVIQLGSVGSLTVSESAGVAKVAIAVQSPQIDNVASVVGSLEVDVQASALVQVVLDLLKSKLPTSVQGLVGDVETAALNALKSA